jgi:type I restriction enzyme S subunit
MSKNSSTIQKGWQSVRLADISTLITKGTTPTTIGGSFSAKGINFIKAESITEDGRFINGKIDHIDEATNNLLKRSIIQNNDLLYSIAGVIGRVALVNKEILPANTNQALSIIRPDTKKVDPKYLFYRLVTKSQRLHANSFVAQSVQSNINLKQVGDFDILLPPLETQRHIASTLSSFDDKIENNNRIITTLETMAQSIFKEWFVKFRFPGHEKTKFVDSEMGKIPEGWEVKKVSDVAVLNRGLSYSSPEINEEGKGLPMINLANFQRGGGFNYTGIKYYTGEYKKTNIVKPGDIVIAMTDLTHNREVIGHPARVPTYDNQKDILISLDVCSMTINDMYTEFLYYMMLSKSFSYLMASSASGTNVSHLSKSSIDNYTFVLPDRDILLKFRRIIQPIFTQSYLLEDENKELVKTRDSLLPKLMNGTVSI